MARISGIELSQRFYLEEIQPVLAASFSDLPHGAAVMGRGSEVLGFDDEMSRDHSWGARVLLFMHAEDYARHGELVAETLRRELPSSFLGHQATCEVHKLRDYFGKALGLDVAGEIRARDWLTFSEHQLRMVTAGAVYHDDVGLQAVRDRFSYYPYDVWLYLLATGWWRVHPEANLVGRTAYVGDELGSALIGSGLVSDLMRLCFLLERQYAPYSKWFGTAFTQLASAAKLSPILWKVVQSGTWQERERSLMDAYDVVARMQNDSGIAEPVPVDVQQLWDRPFKVVWGDFPGALHKQIKDPEVKSIAGRWPAGGVDRFRDLSLDASSRRLLTRVFD